MNLNFVLEMYSSATRVLLVTRVVLVTRYSLLVLVWCGRPALVLVLVLEKIEESVLELVIVLVLVLEKFGYPVLVTRYSYSNFE